MKTLSLALVLLAVTASSNAQQVSILPATFAGRGEHALRAWQQLELLSRTQADLATSLLLRRTSQDWVDNAWVNTDRETNDYDGQNLVEQLFETWAGSSWEASSRSVLTYENDLLTSVQSEINDGGAWVPQNRTLITFSDGQVMQTVDQSFEGGTWVNEGRTTLTRTDGVISEFLLELWDGAAWTNSSRGTNTQQGNDVQVEIQNWDVSTWVSADRVIFGNITINELFEAILGLTSESVSTLTLFFLGFPEFTHQQWDGTAWVNVVRQVKVLNQDGRPVSIVTEEWSENAWIALARTLVTYSAEGKVTSIESQAATETGEWETASIESYTYDTDGLLTSARLQTADPATGVLQNSAQDFFEWSTAPSTGIENEELPTSIHLEPVYPNPFNPQAAIRFTLDASMHARIRVFDALGRYIATLVDGRHESGHHALIFDATGRPSGTYLIRLETPTEVVSQTVTLIR